MYYMLTAGADADGLMMKLAYKKDHRGRSFLLGKRFSATAEKEFERPPPEPIVLTIDPSPDYAGAPMPTFLSQPVPLMSRALCEVIRGAGVDNIDVYRAELRRADGSLASDDYYVFNLLGVISAVDLKNSTFDPAQPDHEIAMSFDSLAIDKKAARDFLMFRLHENITTIIIHERVKKAIEASGIPLVRAHDVEGVALP